MKIVASRGIEFEIDEEDIGQVSGRKWKIVQKKGGKPYVCRTGKGTIYLHRVLMDAPRGKIVDHIDGNSLNNRRSNLRLATVSENAMNRGRTKRNRTGYKGVSFHRGNGRWRARIQREGKEHTLGYFDTPEEAFAAYRGAAKILHGEFARF